MANFAGKMATKMAERNSGQVSAAKAARNGTTTAPDLNRTPGTTKDAMLLANQRKSAGLAANTTLGS